MNVTEPIATCATCAAAVADLRPTKRNPKGPDFRCTDAKCAAAYWLRSDAHAAPPAKPNGTRPAPASPPLPAGLAEATTLYRACVERVAADVVPTLRQCGFTADTAFVHAAAATLLIAVQRGGRG